MQAKPIAAWSLKAPRAGKPASKAVCAALCLLAAGCGAALVRTEGDRLSPEPKDMGRSVIFVGEGRAETREKAVKLALADARARALETIQVRIISDIKKVVETKGVNGEFEIDEKGKVEVRSLASGMLEGSHQVGEPYLEYNSDGQVYAQVAVGVPKASLDPAAIYAKVLLRQAHDALAAGLLEKARNLFRALCVVRPADPVVFFRLARVEEQLGQPARALEPMKMAHKLNDAKRWLEVPGEGKIDLEAELDRLTPHWESLLAEMDRLDEKTSDVASLSLKTPGRVSRSQSGGELTFELQSREARCIVLLWIDDDGLYVLDLPEQVEAVGGRFFEVKGWIVRRLGLGTLNGKARLVAVAVSRGGARAGASGLQDIERKRLLLREPPAVGAERALRSLLESESKAGTLQLATARFEIVP